MDTFRVPVEKLRLPPSVPAGLDVLTLLSLAALMRKTTEDPEPIVVAQELGGYRICDGRHRAVGALIAGRKDVLARLE